MASSIARAGTSCVKEEENIRNSSCTRWTSFPFLTTSKRKDDFTEIDTVRSRETGIFCCQPAEEEVLTGCPWQIHTRWKIPQSNERKWSRRRCLSTNGCSCGRRSDPPFDSTTILLRKVIAGFVRTRQVPRLCQCSADLTSNKHCLLCSKWNRKKKLNEINSGHRVLLLHGGVGKVLGGLIPLKVTMEMNQVLTEQGDLLYKYLEQSFRAWFSWIHLLCYSWNVYSWRRSIVTDGVCK